MCCGVKGMIARKVGLWEERLHVLESEGNDCKKNWDEGGEGVKSWH